MFSKFISASIVIGTLTHAWNYDFDDLEEGPLAWGLDWDNCGDDVQSPINIDYNTPEDGFEEFADSLEDFNISKSGRNFLSQWDWDGEFIHHFQVTNNGHGIVLTPIDAHGFRLNSNETAIAKLGNIFADTFDSPSRFCLDSLHFHWGEYDTEGSEHTQYGKTYPCEVHFVHYSCDYPNLGAALDPAVNYSWTEDTHVLAVVGFFFELDEDADDDEISVLTQILRSIDNLQEWQSTTRIINANMVGSLIPSDMQYVANGEYGKVSYDDSTMWYYEGSLTTPPCYEAVRWHVMDYKLKITSEILEALRGLGDNHNGSVTHNWRPIQDNINTVYAFKFDGNDSSMMSTTLAGNDSMMETTSEGDNGAINSGDDDDEDTGGLVAVVIVLSILLVISWAVIFYAYCGNKQQASY